MPPSVGVRVTHAETTFVVGYPGAWKGMGVVEWPRGCPEEDAEIGIRVSS